MSSKVEQVMRTMIGDLRFEKAVQLGSSRNAQHRAFRAALRRAYTMCARHYYPKWASYLLDEEFQAHGADRLRACYLKGVTCFEPADLAALWADHMGWWLSEVTKERHIAELLPVASRFLRCLEAELCGRPEFHPNFDVLLNRLQRDFQHRAGFECAMGMMLPANGQFKNIDDST